MTEKPSFDRDPTADPRTHLAALDGLRGIAIILVLLVHLGLGGHQNPILGLFFKITAIGWTGVDLFFVLSGFLITRILLSAKESPHYFRDFYMRRILRIFPLYYGVLAITLWAAPWVAGPRPESPSQLWLWFYGTNFYPAWSGRWFEMPNVLNLNFGHFWSLAVEEHFYLIWPWLVWVSGRRKLIWICSALIAIPPVLRIILIMKGVCLEAVFCMTPCRMDALATGALIAVISNGGAAIARWVPPARVLAGITGSVVLGAVIIMGSTKWTNRFMPTVGLSLLAAFFGGALILAINAPQHTLLAKLLRSRILTFFGKYSYGIYVYHRLLREVFDSGPLSAEGIWKHVPSYFVSVLIHMFCATVISVAVAYASWHLYEKWFLKLKRYFEYRPERIVDALPQ